MSEQYNYFLIKPLQGQRPLNLEHHMKGLQKREGRIRDPRNYVKEILEDAGIRYDKNIMIYLSNVSLNDDYQKGWRFDVKQDILYPISSFEWGNVWKNNK